MMYKYYYFIVLNFVFTEDFDNHCPSYENIFRIFCAGFGYRNHEDIDKKYQCVQKRC